MIRAHNHPDQPDQPDARLRRAAAAAVAVWERIDGPGEFLLDGDVFHLMRPVMSEPAGRGKFHGALWPITVKFWTANARGSCPV
jgi:hypothetical protein